MTFLVDQYGQGLHDGLPVEHYYRRELGEANKGALDVVNQSLFHYRYWAQDALAAEAELAERKTFVFGRAFHCCLLEPARFDRDYMTLPDLDKRSTANRLAHDRFHELHAGKEFITPAQYEQTRRLVEAIHMHPLASALIAGCLSERTVTWRDPETGLPCKARLDLHNAPMGLCLDPKSCEDASPEGFAKSANRFRYHIQHVHYSEGMRVIGQPLKYFLFLCIEKDPPYAIAIYKLNAPGEERGLELRNRNMATLARGMRENRFPSYNDDKTAELRLPAFAFYEATDL